MRLSSLSSALAAVVLAAACVDAFSPPLGQRIQVASTATATANGPALASITPNNRATLTSTPISPTLYATADDDADEDDEALQSGGSPSMSQLEGNQRAPTASELSIMDDMITKLSQAEPYELPQAVSKAIRVVSSPQFFMRIASRADQETDPTQKAKLVALGENLVSTIEAVVSTMEDRLDDRAREVERVVKAASEPGSGEFLVPLSADRVEAMREELSKLDPSSLDEGFLSTVDAWMNKSHQDGMDGMVTILQKVLQMYAGMEIKRARGVLQANVGAAVSGESQAKADEVVAQEEKAGLKPAAALMERLMEVDAESWDAEMRKAFAEQEGGEGVSSKALMGEVQRTIEGVVLGLEDGSMAQRVQAEFLKELVQRIEALEKQMS